MNKIHAVLGLVFSEDLRQILLIKKNKPEFQNGKWNGLGGKIEKGEFADKAMRREFREECGIDILECDWRLFGGIDCLDNYFVFLFTVATNIKRYKQIEEEIVRIHNIETVLKYKKIMSNLRWLIPMAQNYLKNKDRCKYFQINEINR